jgi:RimJ/RimL family protein N-acetyltransferase
MRLTTPRLYLREFEADDWQAVQRYQSDPRYLRYYPWSTRSEVDARAFVQRFVGWQHEEPRYRYQLVIEQQASGKLIGCCGLRLPHADATIAELGYELNPACWGQGYATEAARALLDFGFGTLGLSLVRASCLAENHASLRVLARLGMHLEGRQPMQQWMKGRWWDALVYNIRASEWPGDG